MQKLAWILVLAVILIGVGFGVGRLDQRELTTTSQEAYDLYLEGNHHIVSFQYDKGVAKLEKALALDPQFAMAAAALAEGYFKAAKFSERDSLLNVAHDLAADLTDETERMLVQLRASIFGHKELRAVQDSLVTRLEQAAPDHPILLSHLAGVAKRNNRPDEVDRIWHKVLEHNPNYALAYNELGYQAFYRGDFEQAISHLQRYAFLAPDLANPYDSLGEVLREMGRYEEAEEQLKQALRRQPTYFPSLMNLAQVYVSQGRMNKGLKLLDQVSSQVAGTPYEKDVRKLAIGVYYNNQITDKLEASSAEFIDRYPDDPTSVLYRSLRLTFLGDTENAQTVLDSLMTEWRSDSGYAEKAFVKRKIDGTEAEFKALLCMNTHDTPGAVSHWRNTLDLLTDEVKPHELAFVREQFGSCLLADGKTEQALDQAGIILRMNPRNTQALLVAAEANLLLGRITEAQDLLSRLELSLQRADGDYPLLAKMRNLRARVEAVAGNS